MGILFGYDLAFRYVDAPMVRSRIREDVDKMGTYLQDNWYIFFKPDDGLVDRGPNGVFFEYVWSKVFQRITGDSKASKPISWREFGRRITGGKKSLDAGIGLCGKLFSPRKRFTMFLRNIVRLYRWGTVRYFNIHLAFLAAYSVLSGNEKDPEVTAAFENLYEDVQSIPGDENALFAAMARSLLGAEDEQTRRAISTLRTFPEGLPNSWDDGRFRQDNAWQRSPQKRQTIYLVFKDKAPCKYIEYPGLDYLLPYNLCRLMPLKQ